MFPPTGQKPPAPPIRAAGDDGSQTARTRVTYLPGRNQPSTLERELTSGVFATETRTYDAAERLVEIVGPEGETTTIEYLVAERKVRATHSGPGLLQPVVEVTEYDADGREVAFIDGRGQRWETRYDGLGRPVESKNPRGEKALLTYDARNRPTQQRAIDANGCLLAAADTVFRPTCPRPPEAPIQAKKRRNSPVSFLRCPQFSRLAA